MNYEFKSYGSWYEGSHDDKVDSWINPLHHSHFIESWNKLLGVVEDSSKWLEGTLSKGSK